MARIIPKNPKVYNSDAEKKVYKRIEEDFDDIWKCIYSYKWRRWHGPRETDFVLIHKDIGLIAVEVKGGRVECRDGKWKVIDRYGVIENLGNGPIVQVNEGAVNLYKELGRKYNTFYVVIFPDVRRRDFNTNNRDFFNYIIFGDELEALEESIEKIIEFEAKEKRRERENLSDDDIKEIVEHFDIVVSSSSTPEKMLCDRLKKEISHLTKKQMEVYEGMLGNSKMSISGKSGTGKTVLLKIKARMEHKEGKRVLILVFNADLRDEIRKEFESVSNVEIYTISKFMQDETGYAGDDTKELRKQFCAKDVKWDRWDRILVDEAQDIYEDVMNKICELNNVYIFYDKNQNLCEFEVNNEFKHLDFDPKFKLYRNLRNGKEIEKGLENIIGESYRETFKNPEGDFVRLYFVDKMEFESNKIEIDEFINKKIAEVGECIFLTTSTNGGTKFPQGKKYKTVRKAKGLEVDCVLVYDEEELISSETLDIANVDDKDRLARNMLYTACSRGIKEVYIFLIDKGIVENEKIAKRLDIKISDISDIY